MVLENRPGQNRPRHYALAVTSSSAKYFGGIIGKHLDHIALIYHPFYAHSVNFLNQRPRTYDGRLHHNAFGPDIGPILAGKDRSLWTLQETAKPWGQSVAGLRSYSSGPHLTMIIRWIYDIVRLRNNEPNL